MRGDGPTALTLGVLMFTTIGLGVACFACSVDLIRDFVQSTFDHFNNYRPLIDPAINDLSLFLELKIELTIVSSTELFNCMSIESECVLDGLKSA